MTAFYAWITREVEDHVDDEEGQSETRAVREELLRDVMNDQDMADEFFGEVRAAVLSFVTSFAELRDMCPHVAWSMYAVLQAQAAEDVE
jgi:hypothetical protein